MSTPDRMAYYQAEQAAREALVPPAPDLPAAGPQPIRFPGDDDPGGRDDVAGTVAGAVTSAGARSGELRGDTYGQGSAIGDLLELPEVPGQHSKHAGGDDSGYPS